jgi:hypothetical protein
MKKLLASIAHRYDHGQLPRFLMQHMDMRINVTDDSLVSLHYRIFSYTFYTEVL